MEGGDAVDRRIRDDLQAATSSRKTSEIALLCRSIAVTLVKSDSIGCPILYCITPSMASKGDKAKHPN